jgi:hypothetical protein
MRFEILRCELVVQSIAASPKETLKNLRIACHLLKIAKNLQVLLVVSLENHATSNGIKAG